MSGRKENPVPPRLLVMTIILAGFGWPAPAWPEAGDPSATAALDEVVVTAARREQSSMEHAGNIATLAGSAIEAVGHQHIHELLTRVAGVWVSRGSGQEHLTAIRSPVLTGPGSCGAFLTLEDGIPTRPAGFCNVNQMFELFAEDAASVEVIRGPGNALYGANALHGLVNVLMPRADAGFASAASVEAGSHDFLRLAGRWVGGDRRPALVTATVADDGGFRDQAGYRQAKLHASMNSTVAGGSLVTALTVTDLDQQTAGFIVGEDAYLDPAVNRSNPTPDAFRRASSERLYAIWRRDADGFEIDLRPYLRHSDMRFVQHFLPGEPLEENAHVSAGALLALHLDGDSHRLMTGLDVEISEQELVETQFQPATGSAFLQETRPVGKHYDYTVRSSGAAPWMHMEFDASDAVMISFGLRLEYLAYDYDNRMLAGNTRDDGTPCGFGGCLYTRPESGSDTFFDAAPKFALLYRADDAWSAFLTLARGFRPPQATELYRLQSGQAVADLDSERVDSLEAGLRWQAQAWRGEFAAFAMRKRDSIYRDSEGFNVSGAKSRHEGLEGSFDWRPATWLAIRANATYARHRYDFDTVAARGETFVSGNDIDTAPRWLGSLEASVDLPRGELALQWTTLGRHYLDAENRFEYPGHDLLHARATWAFGPGLFVAARLNNLLDEAIADRADYAFGDYRYLPGPGRELFIELGWRGD